MSEEVGLKDAIQNGSNGVDRNEHEMEHQPQIETNVKMSKTKSGSNMDNCNNQKAKEHRPLLEKEKNVSMTDEGKMPDKDAGETPRCDNVKKEIVDTEVVRQSDNVKKEIDDTEVVRENQDTYQDVSKMEGQFSNSIENICDVPQLADEDLSLAQHEFLPIEGESQVNTRVCESSNGREKNVSIVDEGKIPDKDAEETLRCDSVKEEIDDTEVVRDNQDSDQDVGEMEGHLSNLIENIRGVPQLEDEDLSLAQNKIVPIEGESQVNTRSCENNNACTGNISDESLSIECAQNNYDLLAINNTCDEVRGEDIVPIPEALPKDDNVSVTMDWNGSGAASASEEVRGEDIVPMPEALPKDDNISKERPNKDQDQSLQLESQDHVMLLMDTDKVSNGFISISRTRHSQAHNCWKCIFVHYL